MRVTWVIFDGPRRAGVSGERVEDAVGLEAYEFYSVVTVGGGKGVAVG